MKWINYYTLLFAILILINCYNSWVNVHETSTFLFLLILKSEKKWVLLSNEKLLFISNNILISLKREDIHYESDNFNPSNFNPI